MGLHQARHFLAVCNDLNFIRAAKRCNVSQPSLTRAIQLLEQEFGGYLFDRKRSSIELTDLGKLVRPYLQEFWRTASMAKQIAKEYSAKAPKELNLANVCTIAPKLLLQMVSWFRTKHPEIRMQLTDGDAQLLEEKLVNLQIEAAIYCRPDREPDPRLNYLPLFKEQMMIVLASGLGFGFLPRYSIVHDGIIARPLVDPEYWRNIHLVTVRDKPQSHIVGALIHETTRTEWANEGDLPVNAHLAAN